LGAFESGLTAKLMGTVSAVVFGGSMTLITVVLTGHFIANFRKLDLQQDVESMRNLKLFKPKVYANLFLKMALGHKALFYHFQKMNKFICLNI
jgi:hypothetical protein